MENITLSGMMLGMTKKQIRDRIDWIIDFSELGEYIERPMTTYSMGMQARLSFAVAACQEPDILIIDEALATGDIRFVQKCIKRIHEIVQSGTTALFVSHNIWSIKKLTQRCILIDRGKVADDGPTGQVTERFYEVMLKNEVLESGERVATVNNFVGSGEVRLLNIRLLQDRNVETNTLLSGKETFFELEIESSEKREIGTSLECWRLDGISAFSTGISGGSLDTKGNFVNRVLEVPKGKSKLVVQFPSLYLAPGEYYLNLHIFNPNEFSGYTSNEQFYFKTHIKEFRVSKLQNPNHLMVYYQPFETWVEK
jgi:energy-coupling factor transporter ATP-binding protein EcfA2